MRRSGECGLYCGGSTDDCDDLCHDDGHDDDDDGHHHDVDCDDHAR